MQAAAKGRGLRRLSAVQQCQPPRALRPQYLPLRTFRRRSGPHLVAAPPFAGMQVVNRPWFCGGNCFQGCCLEASS